MPKRPGHRAVMLVALLASALLVSPSPAQAATFTVTTTTDAPHTTPVDGNCTSTLPGNPCTLRAAVQAANFLRGTQTINLAVAGTYTLTVVGPREDNAATGDLDINSVNLTLANTSGGTIAIDGNNTDRVFHVGPLAPAQFSTSGLTVQHGSATEIAINALGGGGILVNQGSSLALSNVILTENAATNVSGGGLVLAGTGTLTTVTVLRNTAQGGGGGIENRGTLTLIDSTLSGNVAGSAGGGLANNVNAQARVERTTFVGNAGLSGGAVNNNSLITLTNVTMSGNQANSRGGAFANTASQLANATLINVTMASNTTLTSGGPNSSVGGAVENDSGGILTLKNTIVANSPAGGNCAASTPMTSLGFNISSDGTCSFGGPGDRNNLDPLLGPLSNNGGPTQTHALLPGSPAIDAASPDCPPPATDQRGVSRPQGIRCDIGAFELQLPPTATPIRTSTPGGGVIPINTPTSTPTATRLSVQQAIALVQPSGQQGSPCASQIGQICQVAGTVRGSGTVSSSMTWSLTAAVPAGVAPGTVPVAVFSTTAGLQGFPCAPVAVGGGTVACIGTTAANALQGSVATVVFAPAVVAVGTVTGPGIGPGALGPVGGLPLLPPPPPILLPPPPSPLVPIPPRVAASIANDTAGVPVVPEADTAVLILLGLLGLLVASGRRHS
jgi:CSLREA domain-containing protein